MLALRLQNCPSNPPKNGEHCQSRGVSPRRLEMRMRLTGCRVRKPLRSGGGNVTSFNTLPIPCPPAAPSYFMQSRGSLDQLLAKGRTDARGRTSSPVMIPFRLAIMAPLLPAAAV